MIELPQQTTPPAGDSIASAVGSFMDALVTLDFGGTLLGNLLLSVVVVGLAWLLRRIVLREVDRRVDDPRMRYRWSKSTGYAVSILSTVVILAIWFQGIRSLGTFFGLLSAGLAIALKDPVADLAGWIFILWRRPFDPGDRVQIGDHAGDVVDIRLFQFSILEIGNWVDADQSTGRVIHVPNAHVFTRSLANYTTGFEYIWNEIPVLLTFESDWRKAKDILDEVIREVTAGVTEEAEKAMRQASRKLLIFYPHLTPIVYTSVADSGVLLTIRYLCNPRSRRGTAQTIWEAILDRFGDEPDIDFAYPTTRALWGRFQGPGIPPGDVEPDVSTPADPPP